MTIHAHAILPDMFDKAGKAGKYGPELVANERGQARVKVGPYESRVGAGRGLTMGDDDVPIGPVERFLAHLSDIEKSPNTVKAYAHPKDRFAFLAGRAIDWRNVRLEDVGERVDSKLET